MKTCVEKGCTKEAIEPCERGCVPLMCGQDFCKEHHCVKPQIKPIDEHEWSDGNVVEYVENDKDLIRIYFCGDYNYLELSDSDLAALANARGYKLVKIGGDE